MVPKGVQRRLPTFICTSMVPGTKGVIKIKKRGEKEVQRGCKGVQGGAKGFKGVRR